MIHKMPGAHDLWHFSELPFYIFAPHGWHFTVRASYDYRFSILTTPAPAALIPVWQAMLQESGL